MVEKFRAMSPKLIDKSQESEPNGMRQEPEPLKVKINCDQVAWIQDIFRRFTETTRKNYPGISRLKEIACVAAILELMEILHLEFEDKGAAGNVICSFPEFDELRGMGGGK